MPSYFSHSLRKGMIELCSHPRYTHAVTLNCNQGALSVERLKAHFKHFCIDVDRHFHGKNRVFRLPADRRLDAIAFPEHVLSNAHMHLVVDLAAGFVGNRSDQEIGTALYRIWKSVTCGAGSIDLKVKRDDGWCWYITKEFYTTRDYFLSSDFHPANDVIRCNFATSLAA